MDDTSSFGPHDSPLHLDSDWVHSRTRNWRTLASPRDRGEAGGRGELNTKGPRLRVVYRRHWDIYVPTVTGTHEPVVGNGVLTGRYLRLGKPSSAPS